jgi:predicted HD superfamily hydrolase involved in NAD metabolism
MSKLVLTGSGLELVSIRVELAHRLTAGRFLHSLGVARTGFELARLHGADPEKAYIAGLLHDCARELSGVELRSRALGQNVVLSEFERRTPVVLHGPIGAHIAQREFGVEDDEILEAIAVHATGAPEWSQLAKVVFVGDYIEPRRCFPEARTTRALARVDLEAAVDYKFKQLYKYLRSRGSRMHPLFEAALRARSLDVRVLG